MLRRNMHGAIAQLLAFAGLLINNLIIPKLLGFENFGRVATLLSLPYFAQGLIESAMFALVVQASQFSNTRYIRQRTLYAIVGLYFLASSILMIIYSIMTRISTYNMLLMTAINLAMGTYTISLSMNLGDANGRAVMRNSIVYSLCLAILPVSFCKLFGKGPEGILWSIFATYALCAMILCRDAKGSISLLTGSRQWLGLPKTLALVKKIAMLCGPRLLFVTFNTLAVLVFAAFARPQQVAMYKLVLSAGIAVMYSVPLHPSIFQATLWNTPSRSRTLFILMAACWIFLGSATLFALLPRILATLFRGQPIELGCLRYVPLLTPLLYLVWLTPNLLVDRIRSRTIFLVSLASAALFLAISIISSFIMAADQGLVLAFSTSLVCYGGSILRFLLPTLKVWGQLQRRMAGWSFNFGGNE